MSLLAPRDGHRIMKNQTQTFDNLFDELQNQSISVQTIEPKTGNTITVNEDLDLSSHVLNVNTLFYEKLTPDVPRLIAGTTGPQTASEIVIGGFDWSKYNYHEVFVNLINNITADQYLSISVDNGSTYLSTGVDYCNIGFTTFSSVPAVVERFTNGGQATIGIGVVPNIQQQLYIKIYKLQSGFRQTVQFKHLYQNNTTYYAINEGILSSTNTTNQITNLKISDNQTNTFTYSYKVIGYPFV